MDGNCISFVQVVNAQVLDVYWDSGDICLRCPIQVCFLASEQPISRKGRRNEKQGHADSYDDLHITADGWPP